MQQYQICLLLAIVFFICGEAENVSTVADDINQDLFDIVNHLTIPVQNLTNQPVTADKIRYYLFTSNNPQAPTIIDASNASVLSTGLPIVFLIHGWTQNQTTEWYEQAKNAFFVQNSQWQVIQVDWGFYSELNYGNAQYDTKPVGVIIGEFIANLTTDYCIPLKNILVVGHSLGGQVAGFVGKRYSELRNATLPRIIALDPAGPLFEGRPSEERLYPTDADVVHVIHTNGGIFGYSGNCGTIDFRANEGGIQPGCPKEIISNLTQIPDIEVTCSHHRSYRFFIEGLQGTGKFISKKCSIYVPGVSSTACTDETEEISSLTTNQTGAFFLDTNAKPPYSKS